MYGVLQLVGLAYMRIFIKSTTTCRVGLYANFYTINVLGSAWYEMEWNVIFLYIKYWQFCFIPFPFHTKNLLFRIPFDTSTLREV